MQSLRKTNERSLRYLKTNTRTDTQTDEQELLLRTRSSEPRFKIKKIQFQAYGYKAVQTILNILTLE